MTFEEAIAQAGGEFKDQIVNRGTEIFNGQVSEMEATLASKRSEVDALQAELDGLKSQLPAQGVAETESPAEDATDTASEPQG